MHRTLDTAAAPRARRAHALTLATLLFALAACAAAVDGAEPPVRAAAWPPVWQGEPAPAPDELDPSPFTPTIQPPRATHCRRPPTLHEVPGAAQRWPAPWPKGGESEPAADASRGRMERRMAPAALAIAPEEPALLQVPRRATVTAGMVDDNADFGAYLAYRERHAGLPVRERDIRERYRLEVTDADGRPVHDAEVAVQRRGVAEPVMVARTDTAGRVWLHPRAFLDDGFGPGFEPGFGHRPGDRTLGIAVRKHGFTARAVLVRGQAPAVQLRLAGTPAPARTRLDLVFLVDATGSMGDEIAKLKASMQSIANRIAQLPGRPDLCFGLVAYRDRGDAFVTRTHALTDDLGAFQQVLARLQAGGGGDTPEALNEALHEAVHRLDWRADAARLVVLVGDAPPHLDHPGPPYDAGMQAALAKGIKLFAVGASGLDEAGEYVFRQLAQYTGGRFVFLTYRRGDDPGSGPGGQTVHDVRGYSVQTLDALIVRLVGDELSRLARG